MRMARAIKMKGAAVAILALVLAGALPSAHAAYIIDQKIGEARLPNSGDATELAAMRSFSGIADLELDFKIEGNDVIALQNGAGSGEWYLDVAPATPGYFLLKFGIGGTGATAQTFFFKNIGELDKFVWSDAQVQNLTGGNCGAANNNACNIGRLSHYVGLGSVVEEQLPVPASAALLGIGLVGLGATLKRRRTIKHAS